MIGENCPSCGCEYYDDDASCADRIAELEAKLDKVQEIVIEIRQNPIVRSLLGDEDAIR